jgi:hypothetical protein
MKTYVVLYKAEDTPSVFQYTCYALDKEQAADLFYEVADTGESLIQIIATE